jgi:GTPase
LVEIEHKRLIEIASEDEFVARAGIIHPEFRTRNTSLDRSPERKLEEVCGLAEAIQLEVLYSDIVNLRSVNPGTFLGSGKVKEYKGVIAELGLDLVIVDGSLTPIQQRNLEKAWNTKILDRTGLILEIFSARARTREGRMQVELAHLSYQKSRLVRSWTHLERQRGGLGFVGGPGETQIEADRRMINERITKLRRQLEKVTSTRSLHRKGRKKVPYPVVALVGYTNAGKSTLFNQLTDADVFAEDLLFATLDPTMRMVDLPSGKQAVLSDTVGFISDLPTDLIAAFRATLEEVLEADLILHVRDEASPDSEAERHDVLAVLAHLGVSIDSDHIIEVLNKADLLDPEYHDIARNQVTRKPKQILTSALTGEGCVELLDLISASITSDDVEVTYDIPHSEGRAVAWLYQHGEILQRTDGEALATLTLTLSPADIGKFKKTFHIEPASEETIV